MTKMEPPPNTSAFSHNYQKETWKNTLILSFQSLGIVYGHLGTAPLYVFGTIPTADFESVESVYEFFSFIFWTLTFISLFKYIFIILRADDNGEGGPFALYSLLCRNARVGLLPNERSSEEFVRQESGSLLEIKLKSRARRAIERHRKSHYLMLLLALFGSCAVIGDGVLTPAISVLSASTDLQRSLSDMSNKFASSPKTQKTIADALEKYIPVPAACAILIGLFTLQHYGTHKIGFLFAPIIIIWLLFITGVGIYNIFYWDRAIINAFSPIYMYRFIKNIDLDRWKTLGSILLCVAGSEAMFADLGHFSKQSIKITFICLMYPVLVSCYAGQAAYMSKNLHHNQDFNQLSLSVPGQIRHIFVMLSLLASVVGSQASITASFSIIKQSSALGCFPRVKVIHTSNKIHGQVYIPDVNWLLMALSLAATVGFQDTLLIGNAKGLAIISGMLVTTCLMSLVIALVWEKSLLISACFLMFFGIIEGMYLSACMLNFHKGAWYLVIVLAMFFSVMLAWHYGTRRKYELDVQNKVSTEWLTNIGPALGVSRVPGIGFIYTELVTGVPGFFSHFITNLPAYHQVLIFVTFKSLPVPYVPQSQRYLIGRVGPKDLKVYRCVVRYGYCDYVGDKEDFEDQIIRSIGEFISSKVDEVETRTSSEGKMKVVGGVLTDESALVPLEDVCIEPINPVKYGTEINPVVDSPSGTSTPGRRKKVKFVLPPKSPRMKVSVREELQELVDARESGTAYFLGQSHLTIHDGSNYLKRFLTMIYVFLDKNCREPSVALKVPHAALVEVGMVYTI